MPENNTVHKVKCLIEKTQILGLLKNTANSIYGEFVTPILPYHFPRYPRREIHSFTNSLPFSPRFVVTAETRATRCAVGRAAVSAAVSAVVRQPSPRPLTPWSWPKEQTAPSRTSRMKPHRSSPM